MAEESKPESAPNSVTLRLTSAAGPFARGAINVPTVAAPIRNSTAVVMTLTGARVSTLVVERSGLEASGAALTANLVGGPLAPGDAVPVRIGGAVPAKPGAYAAYINLDGEKGPLITTAVRVEVAARAFWGVGCMLAGLLLLGVLKLLTGEGEVQTHMREVQRTRSEIHLDLQRVPPPESRAESVRAIDRDLDQAARVLAAQRRISVIDYRLEDSTTALAAAREAMAKLRKAIDESPEAGSDVAELDHEWTALQKRVATIAETKPDVASLPEGLARHAVQLLAQARIQLFVIPARIALSDIGAQVDRMILTQAGGDADRGRDMAHATRLLMRRAIEQLEKRLTLVQGLSIEAERMILDDVDMRRLAATGALHPKDRSAMLARLDAIDAALASKASLQSLEEAQRAIGEAGTQALRAQRDAMEAKLTEAANASQTELDQAMQPVNTAFLVLRAVGKPTPEEKAANVAGALAVWRGTLNVVHDSGARVKMESTLDAGIAAGRQGDLKGAASAYEAMKQEWTDYTGKHIARSMAAALAPVCSDWRERAQRSRALTQSEIMLQSDRPEIVDWDQKLDRSRRALEAVAPESQNCVGEIVDGSAPAMQVSQEIFTRMLQDIPIPLETRLSAAETSGVAAAVSMVQLLIAAPRDLQLTPHANQDPFVGEPIIFDLKDIDPDWGTSVALTVDWGDHTTPWRSDAERLRKGERLEHTYAAVGTVHPVVSAYDGQTIGMGTVELYVKPSPSSRAEQLADIFLSTQFALALLIASVVYYWRFHTETLIFGSSGRHYVSAFALGFAAYAAVAELPKALADFALK